MKDSQPHMHLTPVQRILLCASSFLIGILLARSMRL
jgi:hypothetical protein